ncbi:DUF2255 family protein [Arthrobacter sp. NPDC093139]|uniref:DUF2255 family protein n=1 Tax=Arthrobacter sp. NPDC093139 TaxID=3363945 RepID=UPI003812CF9D
MTLWDPVVLKEIWESDDLHIAPFREDGATTGTPTWIWSVVVDGRLFVRAYNGRRSRWYRSAMTQHAGQITAAGPTIEVSFAPADPELQDDIDAAYRQKHAGDYYLGHMVGAGSRAATVEITPRQTLER